LEKDHYPKNKYVGGHCTRKQEVPEEDIASPAPQKIKLTSTSLQYNTNLYEQLYLRCTEPHNLSLIQTPANAD